jgi:hypothetical protein
MVLDPKKSVDEIHKDVLTRASKGEGAFGRFLDLDADDSEEQKAIKNKLKIKLAQFLRNAKKKAQDPETAKDAFAMYKVVDDALDNVETEPFAAMDEILEKQAGKKSTKKKKKDQEPEPEEQRTPDAKADAKRLEKEIESKKEEIETALDRVPESDKKRAEQAEKEINDLRNQIQQVEEVMKNAERESQKALEEVSSLMHLQGKLAKRPITQLNSEIAGLQRELENTEDEEKQRKLSNLQSIKSRYEENMNDFAEANRTRHDLLEKKEGYEQIVRSVNDTIDNLYAQLEELEGQLEVKTSGAPEIKKRDDLDPIRDTLEQRKRELSSYRNSSDEITQENLKKADEEIARAEQIINDLSGDASPKDRKFAITELRPIMDELTNLVTNQIVGRNVRRSAGGVGGKDASQDSKQRKINALENELEQIQKEIEEVRNVKSGDDQIRLLKLQDKKERTERKLKDAVAKKVNLTPDQIEKVTDIMDKEKVDVDTAIQKVTSPKDTDSSQDNKKLRTQLKTQKDMLASLDPSDEDYETDKSEIEATIKSIEDKLGDDVEGPTLQSPTPPEDDDEDAATAWLKQHGFDDDGLGDEVDDLERLGDYDPKDLDKATQYGRLAENKKDHLSKIIQHFTEADSDELPSDFFGSIDDVPETVITDTPPQNKSSRGQVNVMGLMVSPSSKTQAQNASKALVKRLRDRVRSQDVLGTRDNTPEKMAKEFATTLTGRGTSLSPANSQSYDKDSMRETFEEFLKYYTYGLYTKYVGRAIEAYNEAKGDELKMKRLRRDEPNLSILLSLDADLMNDTYAKTIVQAVVSGMLPRIRKSTTDKDEALLSHMIQLSDDNPIKQMFGEFFHAYNNAKTRRSQDAERKRKKRSLSEMFAEDN